MLSLDVETYGDDVAFCMGRSNNQRRRTAKAQGKLATFVPAWTKSKTKQRANQMKVKASKQATGKKLAYNKMVDQRSGKIIARRFRSGGYNNSGKHGNARTGKAGKKRAAQRAK